MLLSRRPSPLKTLIFPLKSLISFDLRSRDAYKDLELLETAKGYEITLKGRRLRTPSKKPLNSTLLVNFLSKYS